jgi:acyl-CoA thioesterase-1
MFGRRNLTSLWVGALMAVGLCAAARAEPLTVVALGDSLTAGYGLAEGEGLVPQLQAWLVAQGEEVEIVNAGVSGDTTAGGLSRLDWSITPETDAMIVTLGGNDLLRGLPPDESRANLDAILKGIASRGLPVLLVPLEAPANFGPEYQADFDAIYPELAAQYGALLGQSFFAPLAGESRDPAVMRPWMQADGVHPNREGVAKIVEVLGPEVQKLLAEVRAGQ